jgi:hypothetical protein
MNIHQKYLTVDQIKDLIEPVLAEKLKAFEFKAVTISEEVAYDGDPMLRVLADVELGVPTKVLVDALNAVYEALRNENEDRLVLMSTSRHSDNRATVEQEDIE